MYRKILQDPLRFPEEVHSDARSLLVGLLNRDPAQRLGVNGASEIRNHPFFARHIDWKKLMGKKIQPPFKPAVVRPATATRPARGCSLVLTHAPPPALPAPRPSPGERDRHL